ncbi:MAG: hypothetical protein KKH98_15155, partial [Spirochaetes bacterium]|nr:hypothetical protein [Spirochaetota bacterium]
LKASNFNGLIFNVKGETGGEFFKVALSTLGLSNQGGRSNAMLYISDFLDGGVTASWQKVVIPFKNFSNITNFSGMKEFTIAFEHDQSSANGSPISGSIYIDNIKFTNSPGGFDEFRIDHFGDKLHFSSVGANIWSGAGDGARGGTKYTDGTGEYTNYKYAMQIDYTNIPFGASSRWYANAFLLGGGADSFTSLPCDFTGYSNLTFYAKNTYHMRPHQVQVVFQDTLGGWGGGMTAESSGGSNPVISTNWQKIVVPLSKFPTIDFTRVKEMSLTINNWCSFMGSSGRLFIDRVQLEK